MLRSTKKHTTTQLVSVRKPFPKPLPTTEASLNKMNATYENTLNLTPEEEFKRAGLEVFPPEVIFKDVEPEQTYEVTVVIRNISKKVRRIKFEQPTTRKFMVDFEAQGPLAAGLALNINVSFQAEDERDYFDYITIRPEGAPPVKLKLHALKPSTDIIFEPFVNFGFIPIGRKMYRSILFRNLGRRGGFVHLTYTNKDSPQSQDFEIDLPDFELKENDHQEVTLALTASDPPVFDRKVITVLVGEEKIGSIDVNATFVKSFFSVVFDDGGDKTSSELPFGSLYFGETRERIGTLVNNGPSSAPFHIKFNKGNSDYISQDEEVEIIKSPHEEGLELSERVMTADPLSGEVPPYSHIPVKFICRTKKFEQKQGFSELMKQEGEGVNIDPSLGEEKSITDYTYTATILPQGAPELSKYPVVMKARAYVPKVFVSKSLIQFGECSCNDKRDYILTIENKNEELPISFAFSKIAQFTVTPQHGSLLPSSKKSVIISFIPKNFGVFSSVMNINILSSIYQIPLKLMGSSQRKIEMKGKGTRGPEALPTDFQQSRKFVAEEKVGIQTHKKEGESSMMRWMKESTTLQLESGMKFDTTDKNIGYLEKREHVQRANEQLREFRREREKSQREMAKLRMRGKQPLQTLLQYENDVDFVFDEGRPPSPGMELPINKDPLYVIKPICGYEPYTAETKKALTFDGVRPPIIPGKEKERKNIREEPKTEAEIRDSQMELDGLQLQKIFAGPKVLDFKRVFMSSEEMKYFSIANELDHNIKVELDTKKFPSELDKSYPKKQIIPPGSTRTFNVILYSKTAHEDFKQMIRYQINGVHNYMFMVKAVVEPVTLDIQPPGTIIDFDFSNTTERVAKRELTLTNNGNADARFAIELDKKDKRAFTVEESSMLIEKGKSKKLLIKYAPNENVENEEEEINLRVQNGTDICLRCIGHVESCDLRVEKLDEKGIDFGDVAVGIESDEKSFTLKNTKRSMAVFYIQHEYEGLLKIDAEMGKVDGDSSKKIGISFISGIEQEYSGFLNILVRGGATKKVKWTANAVIPKVRILEESFEFGQVLMQSKRDLKMTLINESNITASLNLDLTLFPEFSLKLENPELEKEDILVEYKDEEEEEKDFENMSGDVDQAADEEEEVNESDEEELIYTNYKILLKKEHSPLTLKFTYSPVNLVDTGPKNFDLPISIVKISTIPATLKRTVFAESMETKLLIDGLPIDFGKKVVKAKPVPETKDDIMFKNMDTGNSIRWHIDESILEQDDFVFKLIPSEGEIAGGLQVTVRAIFTPAAKKEFNVTVPIYLDNDTQPYQYLEFKGQGIHPTLSFDRSEIILPPVPLGIESRCTFKVINTNFGYENLELKNPRITQDMGRINVSINFPEGRTLGVTRKELKVEAVYTNNTPQSFTSKITFSDDEGNEFSRPISGTTDNCLMSVYPWMLRNQNEFKLIVEDNNVIKVEEDASASDDEGDKLGAGAYARGPSGPLTKAYSKAASSMISRNPNSLVGYSPIHYKFIDEECEFIERWMDKVPKIEYKFPDGIIEARGQPIFDLIYYLTNNRQAEKTVSKDMKPEQQLLAKYDFLIHNLKEKGALLNHIRPAYLLSTADFKKIENKLVAHEERRHKYIYKEAWITLFYQIIKIYYLSRVNEKSFKNIPGTPSNETGIDQYMKGSNIFSVPEMILLKWLGYHDKNMEPRQAKQIINFKDDLMDSTVIANVIQSHYGPHPLLKTLKLNCSTDEQHIQNAKIILEVCQSIGIHAKYLEEKSFLDPNPREMILFCIHLFQSLQHYIPKATIEFPCQLGEDVTKYIQLQNTSKNRLHYWVGCEGATGDFSIPTDKNAVFIEAASEEKFPVKFKSRISKQVTGKLIFTSKSEGNVQAAAMVFKLVSNVLSRKTWEPPKLIESRLYDVMETQLEVQNPFSQDVIYKIQLNYLRKDDDVRESQKAKFRKKKVEKRSTDLPLFPSPFFCRQENVRVKKGITNTISVTFLPFELGQHKCQIILTDEKVGELQYEIHGYAKWPKPLTSATSQTNFTCPCDAPKTFDITLPDHNAHLKAAKDIVVGRAVGPQKVREREIFGRQEAASQAADTEPFELTVTENANFTGPPQVFIYSRSFMMMSKKQEKESAHSKIDSSKGEHGKSNSGHPASANILALQFHPKHPRMYKTLLVFSNMQKTDIRVLEVSVNAHPPQVNAQLEFLVPSGEEVSQDIPFNNESDKRWTISASLTQDVQLKEGGKGKEDGGFFSIKQNRLEVEPKSVRSFQLNFVAHWLCEVKGMLRIENQTTRQMYNYELKGIADDPMAEGTLQLKCKARKTTKHKIELKNKKNQAVNYNVKTDIQNATGPKIITVPNQGSSFYELSVTPLRGGTYLGAIYFYQDNTDRYIWYTVEIQTEPPKAEGVIQLDTFVRRAASVEIPFKNPIPETVVFEVILEGIGLLGDPTFTLPPSHVGTYEVIFSPLLAGESFGKLYFVNEKMGEIWYDLELRAENAPPINLELLQCELGKTAETYVQLENPTPEELPLVCTIANITNFEVYPERIILPPYSAQNIRIVYTPSNLESNESSQITFENRLMGKWIYYVEGRGLLPTLMDQIPISTSVGNSTSSIITFKNPFKEAAVCEVELETADTKIFALLVKKNKFSVGPMGVLQIPYSFSPHAMAECNAVIIVSMGKQLAWRYPIKGIAESVSTIIDFHFKCKSRAIIHPTIEVKLPGLMELKENELFTHELVPHNENMSGILERSVLVEAETTKLEEAEGSLRFLIKFEPLRPFKATTDFLIYKSTGGRWRFNAVFEALEPDIDDVINITSPLHKTSSVSFKLTNHMRAPAQFIAFFTHDSASEFAVFPKEGTLEQYGRDGTNFIVSFTPTEYGKPKVGKLVIQTEEMQWTYEIKGSHPAYKIPEPKGGRIENKLGKDVMSKLLHKDETKPKNFLKENMKSKPTLGTTYSKKTLKKGGVGSRDSSPNKSRPDMRDLHNY